MISWTDLEALRHFGKLFLKRGRALQKQGASFEPDVHKLMTTLEETDNPNADSGSRLTIHANDAGAVVYTFSRVAVASDGTPVEQKEAKVNNSKNCTIFCFSESFLSDEHQ